MTGDNGMELSEPQRLLLETIYSGLKSEPEGGWPTFAWVEDELYDRKIELEKILHDLPADLITPDPRSGGAMWFERGAAVGLRVRGLAACSGTETEIAVFVSICRWLGKERSDARAHTPREAPDPRYRVSDLMEPIREVTGEPVDARLWKLMLELIFTEPRLPNREGDPTDITLATFTIPLWVRKLRNIESFDDYLSLTKPRQGAIATQIAAGFGAEWRRTFADFDASGDDAMMNAARDRKRVMVVYGRNAGARVAMFTFLRSLSLQPIEWEEAVTETGRGSPHNLEAVEAAMRVAQAVVVVLTAEDEARLMPRFAEPHDRTELIGQPRLNVILEAGLAMGLDRDRTILVELGAPRGASDFEGLNVVRLTNDPGRRSALKTRLANAGCEVRDRGSDWMTALAGGDFEACLAEPARTGEDDAPTPRSTVEPPENIDDVERRITRFLDLYQGIDQPFGREDFRQGVGVPEDRVAWVEERIVRLLHEGRIEQADAGGYYPC